MAMKEQSAKRRIKILIVDDHPIVRYGISRILNKEEDLVVCGEAEDGNETLLAIDRLKPDLILMDISLKRYDGLNLTRIIHIDHPEIPVLILSMHDESVYARKALRCGAKGYIMKEESSEKLVPAIRRVLRGDVCVSENVNKNVLTAFTTPSSEPVTNLVDTLSDRERQVFILLGQGYSSRAIADKLFLSVKTVETHRSRAKLKLAMSNNQQLLVTAAEWAAKEGLKPTMV